jgi:lipoyl(octanoyl) transferase
MEALRIQETLQKQRINNECVDTLLFLDHPPVLTKGIRGDDAHILVSEEELETMGVQIVKTKRGGDVTYLGPGQLIGYPIMDLKLQGHDVQRFVHRIEATFMNILRDEFGIDSYKGEKKYTGVFVGNDKITAMGIAVNRWVTMHGFAMNLNTNLDHFKWIVPCGLHDRGVTSIHKLTGITYDPIKMGDLIIEQFEELFNLTTYEISKEEFLETLKLEPLLDVI